jgi:hypothetical protein
MESSRIVNTDGDALRTDADLNSRLFTLVTPFNKIPLRGCTNFCLEFTGGSSFALYPTPTNLGIE